MIKEIGFFKKLISLLLISVCLGDTLVLKDKTKYNGTLIKFGSDEIMFKYFLPYSLRSKNLTVVFDDIQELQLSDGTTVIENGDIVESYRDYAIGDTLILKINNKTVHNGILIKFENNEIIFKAILSRNWSKKLTVNINDIQQLKLSNGTRVIENGITVATNKEHIKNTSYNRYLSVVKAGKTISPFRLKVKKELKAFVALGLLPLVYLYIQLFELDLGWPDGPWPGDGHS